MLFLCRIPIVEATGKLDEKALAALYKELKEKSGTLEVVKVIGEQEQPVTLVEMKIAHIWSELLNLYILDTEESFFDLGGHSLLAASLASKINEQFTTNLSIASIFKHPTISAQASLITMSCGEQRRTHLDFQAEINKFHLDLNGLDSKVRAFRLAVSINPNKFGKGNVLLTGATGFVGCYLLEELLLHTQCTVYCLMRESPDGPLMQRLTRAREQYGLRGFVTERVIPLKGDVSLDNLGLSKDLYNALSVDVDVVIHAAAQVNLILPSSAVYSSNVVGTFNILTFSLNSKIKPLHYISTNAVFPPGLLNVEENTDLSQCCNQLETGYSQTKWLAEQLMLSAAQKGCPTSIYRCGNIGGSSLVPGWNPSDFNLHMFRGVLKTGFAPDIKWLIELTPVDFVSKVIIHLVCNPLEAFGKTFHFINNSKFDCKDLWEIFKNLGYSINKKSFEQWKQTVLKISHEDTKLSQLSYLLENLVMDESFFLSESTCGQENLTHVLKKMSITYPQLTNQLFRWYVNNLSSLRILPCPDLTKDVSKTNRNLEGKVVMVTGASSGIGEGIAQSLALEGATVVLAARRVDKLTRIAKQLNQAGAKTFPMELDICDAQKVYKCVQDIEASIGPIDVLVNNAGVMYYQFMKNCDLPRWQHMVQVNIQGTLNCTAAVLSHMVARGSGHIVNISSDGSRKPFPGLAVYCGTKYFVRCLSGALRSELATSGVKVTDIQPGDVTSELHNYVTDPEAELQYDWSSKVPILKPSDVGDAVLYVLSQPPYCAVNEILLEPQLLPLY